MTYALLALALTTACALMLVRPHTKEPKPGESDYPQEEDSLELREKLERLLQIRSDLVLDFETGKITKSDFNESMAKVSRAIRFREKELEALS